MRVTFKTEGGVAHFPGLARPVQMDTAELTPDEARELEESVRASKLLERDPDDDSSGTAARDARCHTITVEDGKDRRSARVCDPVQDPKIGSLITLLEGHRRRVLAELR
ncbi:MAG: hypothetical protein M3R38_01380 [Actinomycetota bacterium]|nr:hypothetical protein [Actinomycetota bacterium]